MTKTYKPNVWELETLLDATRYSDIARCVNLVEHQFEGLDDRKETTHAADFGPLIQEAFLMAVVSQMEHHLKKVCDVVAEMRNWKVRMTDIKGANGFESSLVYLKKVLQLRVPDVDERVVRGIVKLRNGCVHAGGYLQTLPDDLGAVAQYVEMTAEGQLRLNSPFVQEACNVCWLFVETVVGAVKDDYSAWKKSKKR
jgi:hypothetical protein